MVGKGDEWSSSTALNSGFPLSVRAFNYQPDHVKNCLTQLHCLAATYTQPNLKGMKDNWHMVIYLDDERRNSRHVRYVCLAFHCYAFRGRKIKKA